MGEHSLIRRYAEQMSRVEYLLEVHEGGVDVYGAIKALQYSIVLPPAAAYDAMSGLVNLNS